MVDSTAVAMDTTMVLKLKHVGVAAATKIFQLLLLQ
jgi:hypothetical protein